MTKPALGSAPSELQRRRAWRSGGSTCFQWRGSQLADENKARAAIAKLLEDAGLAISPATFEGHAYWWLPDDDVTGIAVAVVDGELAVGLLPFRAKDQMLSYLLGIKRPQNSMADSGELAQIRATYGFQRHGLLGFVSLRRIAESLTGEKGPAHAFMNSFPMFSDPACQKELPALFDVMPRVVLGPDVVGATRKSSRMIFETRADITDKLAQMVRAVPGLSIERARSAKLVLGIGLHSGRLLGLVAQKAQAFAEAKHQCPALAALEPDLMKLSAQLLLVGMSPFARIRGLQIRISQLDLDAAPPQVSGVVVVAADDPRAVIEGLATLWPGLRGVSVKRDAPPIELAHFGLPPPYAPVHIAMTEGAFGLSLGAGARSDLSATLASVPSADPPFFLLRVGNDISEAIGHVTGTEGSAARAVSAKTPDDNELLWVGSVAEKGVVLRLEATAIRRSETEAPAPQR